MTTWERIKAFGEWAEKHDIKISDPILNCVSTLSGFLCLWLSIAAFLNANDWSPIAWIILLLGVLSVFNHLARFQEFVRRATKRKWPTFWTCVLFMILSVGFCFWTARQIYGA